jgi:long-chain acyl-CoA synthetase
MLIHRFHKAVDKNPEAIAIISGKKRITYQHLKTQVEGLASGFMALGIKPGECVVTVLPNCPEFITTFYAVASLNLVFLPLNHLFKSEEISYYIVDSNAKAIVTDAARFDMCRVL